MMPFIIPADEAQAFLLDSNIKKLLDSLGRYLRVSGGAGVVMPSHNGGGALADAIECVTTSELNGGYELAMSYPMDGINAEIITNGSIILAPNKNGGGLQPYRIYRVVKSIGGLYSIYARHIVQTDLAGIPVKPFSASNTPDAMSRIGKNAMVEHNFDITTHHFASGDFHFSHPVNALALLGGMDGNILTTFGGELEYDATTVTWLPRLGADNGVRVAYGLNLVDFEQEANIADTYTGAVGYWEKDGVCVYTAPLYAAGNYPHHRIAVVDFGDKFGEEPSRQLLEIETRRYMERERIGEPKVSIALSFVDLSHTTEFSHIQQGVELGDTITVDFRRIGVSASARIVKTAWNVLADRYDAIEVGDARQNIADTIAAQQADINKLKGGR